MADRDRKRIRGVIWARLLEQAEQRLDHPRDLILLCTAAAADRPLDLLRGVARARKATLSGSEHDDPARLSDGEGGTYVLPEIELLERHCIGLVLADQRLDSSVDIRQTPLLRSVGRGLDDAAVERHEAPVATCDDAIARVCQARVYAEDDHAE